MSSLGLHTASLLVLGLIFVTLAAIWWRRFPIVTGLALANVLVFIVSAVTDTTNIVRDDFAFKVTHLSEGSYEKSFTVLTSAFLHAGGFHLFGNMLILILLGLPFEDRVGRVRFLLIYLFAAVTGAAGHAAWVVLREPVIAREFPVIGASGAVFGVIGAFAILYPNDRVTMPLGPIIVSRVPVWLGAVVAVGFESFLLVGERSFVAHAAHLGGLAGGALSGYLLRPAAVMGRPVRETRIRIDYDKLERLASDARQRQALERVRANEDQRDVQRVWIERLATSLACPQCGSTFHHEDGGAFACPNGHRERYVL